ncbi:MAG TPA: DNA recombination protein RmuC [Candidatus Paceibacterota bacterium]|jgi:DNA recombination protein RmuC|nr:DNA recombination protein RmuC [Candidatus Paceibacterota bacterium]
MQDALIIVLVALIAALAAFLWLLYRKLSKLETGASDGQSLNLVLQQINEINRTVDMKLGESHKLMSSSVNSQFSESQRLVNQFIKEVTAMTDKVARVEETGKQMMSIADQLNSLEDILKNPKQRGILGEYYLEALLKNVLPPGSYQMQYPFADGTIVDAAVFVKDKIIPIDSKFSLENYNRLAEERSEAERERLEKLFVSDLKLRIQETSKYIQPGQSTMDFAFMFIPHEAIYYDLLINKIGGLKDDNENLIQRAAAKYRVIIVSPTSFLAYLQTVLQGLKALQIEERAAQIIKNVEDLGKHLKAYEEYHGKLGTALGTVVNHYNKSSGEFKKIDKDMVRIGNDSLELGIDAVEKPYLDD